MNEYKIKQNGYNLVYRKYNRDVGVIKELVRYELVGNSKLFLVMATYAKFLKPSRYYLGKIII